MEIRRVILTSVILGIFLLYIFISLQKPIGTSKLPDFAKHSSRNPIDNGKDRKPQELWRTKPRGVFYLKVNKAGSTTFQAMFNQYAEKHDQIVGMPCSNIGVERHLVGWPEPFKPEHLIPLRKNFSHWEHLNEHIKYSPKIKQAMAPGSVFIASILEPLSHFYSYYNCYNMENTYKQYLKQPNKFKYFLKNIKTMPHLELMYHMPPSNPIAECFGMSRALQYNITAIKEKIREIEKDFDLVMVIEYIEESLILLTQCSDLTIEDVAILVSKNVKNTKHVKPVLSPGEYQNLIQWNLADSLIYDHFNKNLWKKIDNYGRDKMAIKIKELKQAKLVKQKKCDFIERQINLKSTEDMKLKQICLVQKMDWREADKYFRSKMTKKGVYDIEKAQKTCNYPPGEHGE